MDKEKVDFSPSLEAVKLIREKEGSKTKVSGVVPCPVCGKDLRYSIASNGHISGRCESGDVGFMM
jgi:ssDNA-binding Zn-finger/Zn-ribbon topoisomerase 1